MAAQRVYLERLLNSKNCMGVVWHTQGRHYAWQNSNDMGFMFSTDWDVLKQEKIKETLLRKIKIGSGYICVLRNNYGYKKDDTTATLTTIKALMKQCWAETLTAREQKLADKYWRYGNE